MSRLFENLMSGLITLVIVAAAVTFLWEGLLTSSAAYDAFVAVFDCFPFANETAAMVANICQYGTTFQGLTPANVVNDLSKIFGNIIVCSIIGKLAYKKFLPMPCFEDWYDADQYTKTPSYVLKACALNVVLMPLCAFLTTLGLDMLQLHLQKQLPSATSVLVSLIALLLVFVGAILVSNSTKSSTLGRLTRHRLIYNLLGGILKILGMNFICFMIALAFLNNQIDTALLWYLGLFLYLGGMELLIGFVAGKFNKS